MLRRIFYRDAPEAHDFMLAQRSGFHPFPPLHVKDVGSVDLDRVAALQVCHPETKHFFQRQRRWVEDVATYEELFARDVVGSRARSTTPKFKFPCADIETMTGRKFDISDSPPTAYCAGWPRVEKEGARRRPLFEPFINDNFRRNVDGAQDDLERMHQSSAARVREQSARRRFAVLFDFAAWYDQILLSPAVRRFFGIRLPDGRVGTLRAIPMGFRPSCAVAQAITWMLVDFLDTGKYAGRIEVATCIDNVRFVGDDKALLREAAEEFVRRCNYVGATLNEYSLEPVQEYDFLGVHYNHTTGTRALAMKSVNKLGMALEVLAIPGAVTRRQIAAVFGIAFYAADVLRSPLTTPALHYDSLRFYRKVMTCCKERAATDDLGVFWDEKVVVPIHVKTDTALWIQELARNVPVPAGDPTTGLSKYDLVLVTDASEDGWGAMSWSPGKGTIEFAHGVWSATDQLHALCRSTVSEPLGVLRALRRFVSRAVRRVLLLTDHSGLTYAVNAGFGRSEAYNSVMSQVALEYPWLGIEAAHIPGVDNPVDGISRGASALGADALRVVVLHCARLQALQEQEAAAAVGHGWMV